ncbi:MULTISPECIES: ABC transporter permease [Mammaliicoccus]|uniref:ABC transporter permease n=1 Tax=Mammaliicoccus sciuri TaxID=1296 RepID=A0AAW5LIK8_MAMSC|nr:MULTISPECIES: ABC transporter permease [Mammaliicoccus]KTT85085.1 ABC transporter permease [Mammaliicoccus sciuri]MBA1395893.1 FtsX-like permease family protein [Mammaliicoccus sciuri]MBF0720282.1 ABC transporter permease [Mammaliicoccus sciuri]MBG9206517.1 ABC transporter permease [Mammaliicoccus sciuri]MBG9209110.1 ABC transporter permease [Mammaliicoccus sciuri]
MKNLPNIISVSLKSIMKNKRRNIFTMIGIIIGIAAVITIMSLGNGFKKTAADEFADTGASKGQAMISFMPENMEGSKENPFDKQDIELVKQIDGVTDAKIKEDDSQSYGAKMTNSQKQYDINIFKKDLVDNASEGKGFTQSDNELKEKVVTIDQTIAKKAFKGDAIGKTLFIDDQGFKIVGIVNNPMYENTVNMPSETFNRYMGDLSQELPQLELKVDNDDNKKEIANKAAKLLNKRGSGMSEGSYQYSDMEEVMKSITQVFDAITYFVAAVAGISLFIAGIGVMNVMYISVAERTEEIAIRRAFGAKGRDIEIQFLIESIVLCLIGGIIGLIIGILISKLVEAVTPDMVQSVVSLGSILLAVGVSTLIGIVFGWIPARSASKKELIDIIK